MSKDILDEHEKLRAWAQKAKALLFDCMYSLDSSQLVQEATDLLLELGGYDPAFETSKTPLQWP